MRTKFIVGNWKMFMDKARTEAFATELAEKYQVKDGIDIGICAPFTLLDALNSKLSSIKIAVGAQNMHFEEEGAFTGEISPLMLLDIGIKLAIIGHSERRQYFGETNSSCNKKLKSAFSHKIRPIYCVGEVLEEREAGKHIEIVSNQIEEGLNGLSGNDVSSMVIAYEPVWAIGTGKVATDEQAQEMCKVIRQKIASLYSADVAEKVIIQYGGSVKPENAKAILTQPDIDGALVGGASLGVDSFLAIANY
jgi:triosephosphate isomerase